MIGAGARWDAVRTSTARGRAAAAVTHCGGTVRSTREACARRLETRALELVARGRLKAEQAEALVETQRQVIQSAVYN